MSSKTLKTFHARSPEEWLWLLRERVVGAGGICALAGGQPICEICGSFFGRKSIVVGVERAGNRHSTI